MLNLTCPALVNNDGTRCDADAAVLEVDNSTGEFTAFCREHGRDAGGRGYTVVWTDGPLHSTSLFTR